MVMQIGDGAYLMGRKDNGGEAVAPLFIHQFHLIQNSRQLQAGQFLDSHPELRTIDNTPDKLKWCRHKMGLMQKEVAGYAGIYRSTYASYEKVGRDYYPIEKMLSFARLFKVDVTELMDDYNLFLYLGQGKQIQGRRKQIGMTQEEYAERLHVPLGTLKEWERDRHMMPKKAWSLWRKQG